MCPIRQRVAGKRPCPRQEMCGMKQLHVPSSRETSSMSSVTDMRCFEGTGHFSSCSSSSTLASATACSSSSLMLVRTPGTGESDRASWASEELDVRRMRDRDLERRRECVAGLGLMSGASSKVSCAKQPWSATAGATMRCKSCKGGHSRCLRQSYSCSYSVVLQGGLPWQRLVEGAWS